MRITCRLKGRIGLEPCKAYRATRRRLVRVVFEHRMQCHHCFSIFSENMAQQCQLLLPSRPASWSFTRLDLNLCLPGWYFKSPKLFRIRFPYTTVGELFIIPRCHLLMLHGQKAPDDVIQSKIAAIAKHASTFKPQKPVDLRKPRWKRLKMHRSWTRSTSSCLAGLA